MREAAVRPVLHQEPVDRARPLHHLRDRQDRDAAAGRVTVTPPRPPATPADRQRDDHRRRGLLPRQRLRRRRAAHRSGTRMESRVVREHRAAARHLRRVRACAATFFVLGWVAERHPALVRRDRRARATRSRRTATRTGWSTTRRRAAFRDDVRRAKRLLEDAAGARGARLPRAELLDHAAIAVGARRADRGRLRVRLQHLSDPPRSLRHSGLRGTRTRSIDAAGTLVEVPGSTTQLGPLNLPVGRRRLLPPPAVLVDALGHRAAERARAAAGDLLPAPVGDRSGPAAAARRAAQPVPALPQPRRDRSAAAAAADRLPLRHDREAGR